MDCGGVATITELAAELRRACARGWGLPSANSGHGRAQGVAGKTVEGCGGDGGARRELAPPMAMAGSRHRGCSGCGEVSGEGEPGKAK